METWKNGVRSKLVTNFGGSASSSTQCLSYAPCINSMDSTVDVLASTSSLVVYCTMDTGGW